MSKWNILASGSSADLLPEPDTFYTIRFDQRVGTSEEQVDIRVVVEAGNADSEASGLVRSFLTIANW